MTKQMERRVQKARELDAEFAALEQDFFEWWANQSVDEEPPSEIVGVYLRAAYGAGYIAALKT